MNVANSCGPLSRIWTMRKDTIIACKHRSPTINVSGGSLKGKRRQVIILICGCLDLAQTSLTRESGTKFLQICYEVQGFGSGSVCSRLPFHKLPDQCLAHNPPSQWVRQWTAPMAVDNTVDHVQLFLLGEAIGIWGHTYPRPHILCTRKQLGGETEVCGFDG